jgi:hypothetical protein
MLDVPVVFVLRSSKGDPRLSLSCKFPVVLIGLDPFRGTIGLLEGDFGSSPTYTSIHQLKRLQLVQHEYSMCCVSPTLHTCTFRPFASLSNMWRL